MLHREFAVGAAALGRHAAAPPAVRESGRRLPGIRKLVVRRPTAAVAVADMTRSAAGGATPATAPVTEASLRAATVRVQRIISVVIVVVGIRLPATLPTALQRIVVQRRWA